MKYLYVEMFDHWNAYHEIYMGSAATNCKRIIKVPLTNEQERMIEPAICGQDAGRQHFEKINPICIQEEQEGTN